MTVKVEVALGDVDPQESSTQYTWADWTTAVELDQQGVYTLLGYRDGSGDPSTTEIRFRGKNADLRWHIEHANNPYFGQIHERTPIRISRTFDAVTTVRAVAYLAEVTIIEDAAGNYLAADIVAYGALFWLETDTAIQSILYDQFIRFSQNGNLVAYWPGEDPSGATSLRSAVAGQPPVTSMYLIDTGADADVTGSRPLWRASADASSLSAVLAPYSQPSPQAWSAQIAFKVPEEPAGTQPFLAVNMASGTISRWLLDIVPGTPAQLQVRAENASGASILTGTVTVDFLIDESEPWNQLVGATIAATQNGADVDWELWLENGSGQLGTVTGQTLGPVKSLYIGPSATGLADWTFGHWAVWRDTLSHGFVDFTGQRGENLLTAWFNVATNAQTALSFYDPATDTTSTTGILEPDIPVNKLKLLARSEGGLLVEDFDGNLELGLRADFEGAAPALTIDRSDKQIRGMLAVRDGFRRANRVTVTNQGGSEIAVDAPEPYSPATVGYVLDRPLQVNLLDDTQVRGAGEWEVAQLSYPDLRRRITLELLGPASALRTDYLANVRVGSRILVTDNPTYSSLDDVDQQVMSIEEWHSKLTFTATLHTRPAAVWADAFIAETGAGNLSRADTAGCVLLAAVDDNDTALLVGTRGRPETGFENKWSTSSGLPYDLALRTRDRVTCTAVTNRTPVFVAAGAAAHADYAAITPGAAAGMAAGDCELLFTAIRDSGFSYVTGVAGRRKVLTYDQTGWTRLAEFGGVNGCFQLWGRTWQSTPLTPPPELVPEGGAAGDTISAQTCAFRYVQPVIHTAALGQTNTSAVDIAYPGLGIIRPSCVALLAMQREDDWTSVASPAGWTEIGEPDSTLGGDQGLAWYYQIQTTATNTTAGSAVVTGGTGVSRSIVISLISDVQTLTVTRAINGAVTSHPTGADVRLWRAGRATR